MSLEHQLKYFLSLRLTLVYLVVLSVSVLHVKMNNNGKIRAQLERCKQRIVSLEYHAKVTFTPLIPCPNHTFKKPLRFLFPFLILLSHGNGSLLSKCQGNSLHMAAAASDQFMLCIIGLPLLFAPESSTDSYKCAC